MDTVLAMLTDWKSAVGETKKKTDFEIRGNQNAIEEIFGR